MMRRRGAMLVGILLLVLQLTACATGGPVTEPTPEPGRSSPRLVSPRPVVPPGQPADVPAARWDAIAADLARRGVAGPPAVVSAEWITWRDGSLGCPQPGRSYTQALVEGMRVVVTADEVTYDYRFGRGDAARLCEG